MFRWNSYGIPNQSWLGLVFCPLDRREGVLIDVNEQRSVRRTQENARYSDNLLMHLDTNTRSTKHGRSPAPTMMRASVYGARLHSISVLVSGRRYPPLASLRLFPLRNSRSQRPFSFLFLGRGNRTRWWARRCSITT